MVCAVLHVDKLTYATRKVGKIHDAGNSRRMTHILSCHGNEDERDETDERINTIYFPVLNFLDGFSNVGVCSPDVRAISRALC